MIQLDDNGKTDLLRAGMNCTAEIIVEQYQEATYIPVQAVLRVGGKPTVYVFKGQKAEPRTVETGLDNNAMVIIKSGLEPGEIVSLAPPLLQASLTETGPEPLPALSSDQGAPGQTNPSSGGISERKEATTGSDLGGRTSGSGYGFMDRFDSNSDGKVSRQEFKGPSRIFDDLDKDRDGFITDHEVPAGPRPGNSRPPGDGLSSGQAGPEGEK